MPTKDRLLAVAWKLVQLRLASLLALSSARPKVASSSCRPMAPGPPAPTPTKAPTPAPPTSKASAATALPSARVTLRREDSNATWPLKVTKSNSPRLTLPAARVSSPKAPSLSSTTVCPVLPAITSS